ncbi:MAG: DUF1465 family protein, partial [Novosphingobium sp.]|nr:DUF1465 family protein [Novosphingobium sp.]
GRLDEAGRDDDAARIALSCEALRTMTRMMQAIAWLLNHRAYFAGDLSDFQLRRYGRLVPDHPGGDPAKVALLELHLRELIAETERFYARLLRLDRGWREAETPSPSAIERLRERIAQSAAR